MRTLARLPTPESQPSTGSVRSAPARCVRTRLLALRSPPSRCARAHPPDRGLEGEREHIGWAEIAALAIVCGRIEQVQNELSQSTVEILALARKSVAGGGSTDTGEETETEDENEDVELEDAQRLKDEPSQAEEAEAQVEHIGEQDGASKMEEEMQDEVIIKVEQGTMAENAAWVGVVEEETKENDDMSSTHVGTAVDEVESSEANRICESDVEVKREMIAGNGFVEALELSGLNEEGQLCDAAVETEKAELNVEEISRRNENEILDAGVEITETGCTLDGLENVEESKQSEMRRKAAEPNTTTEPESVKEIPVELLENMIFMVQNTKTIGTTTVVSEANTSSVEADDHGNPVNGLLEIENKRTSVAVIPGEYEDTQQATVTIVKPVQGEELITQKTEFSNGETSESPEANLSPGDTNKLGNDQQQTVETLTAFNEYFPNRIPTELLEAMRRAAELFDVSINMNDSTSKKRLRDDSECAGPELKRTAHQSSNDKVNPIARRYLQIATDAKSGGSSCTTETISNLKTIATMAITELFKIFKDDDIPSVKTTECFRVATQLMTHTISVLPGNAVEYGWLRKTIVALRQLFHLGASTILRNERDSLSESISVLEMYLGGTYVVEGDFVPTLDEIEKRVRRFQTLKWNCNTVMRPIESISSGLLTDLRKNNTACLHVVRSEQNWLRFTSVVNALLDWITRALKLAVPRSGRLQKLLGELQEFDVKYPGRLPHSLISKCEALARFDSKISRIKINAGSSHPARRRKPKKQPTPPKVLGYINTMAK
ncbi:hypothetical protein PF007_g5048 [Phytophthora fragariae]|uniref:Uncharacterized protein n=1 Tax=Phytophthora fragariae TaxID=53985 RepID=A0A6A3T2N4_9STRA|nr:hypothetical protein PF007_g5048 [Phytophthora fragariae]KAE9219161.1 hypothetical protein PF004_g13684 [Phytophthora fragariae]